MTTRFVVDVDGYGNEWVWDTSRLGTTGKPWPVLARGGYCPDELWEMVTRAVAEANEVQS